MKFIFFIILSISLTGNSSAHNHFPITIDSELMINRGKIAYEKAKNWRPYDSLIKSEQIGYFVEDVGRI